MSELPLSAKIEAVLFYKSEPIKQKKLAELLSIDADALLHGLSDLEASLAGRGLQLVRNGEEIMLGTAAVVSELIESIQREEISRDLGRAGLETLSIVLYKGPVSRRGIDYIRGVNSAFIVRNLLVRGLVERVEGDGKERGYLYKPTTELLSFMGLGSLEKLPEYSAMREEMEKFAATEHNEEQAPDPAQE